MALSEGAASFIPARLQNAALDSLHAGWLAGEAALIAKARGSHLGRRWLAGRLVPLAPALFAAPAGADLAAALEAEPWLLEPGAPAESLRLQLGMLALAAPLRGVVSRLEAHRVRRVLGPTLYRELLRAPTAATDAPAGFAAALVSDAALHSFLLRSGEAELGAYAAGLHPAAGERVRLAFAPAEPAPTLLDAARIEPLLRAAGSPGIAHG